VDIKKEEEGEGGGELKFEKGDQKKKSAAQATRSLIVGGASKESIS